MSDIDPMSDEENFFDDFNDNEPNSYKQALNSSIQNDMPNSIVESKSLNYQSGINHKAYFDDDILDNDSLGLDETLISTQNEANISNKIDFNKNDQLQMIYMRSYINKIEKNFQEKNLTTQNIREEINECKIRLEKLECKRDETIKQIQKAQKKDGITLVNRLNAERENICKEVELEFKVLETLTESFNKADYERSKALLEKTKYSQIDKELKRKEELLIKQKDLKVSQRKQIEDEKTENLKKKFEKSKQMQNERIKQENLKQKEAIEQAKRAREITSQYLKQTLREMKDQKSMDETQNYIQIQNKRKEIIGLKNVIDHNKEVFQAKVMKKKYQNQKELEELEREKNEIQSRGENPNFFIPRKLKMQQYEKEKEIFEDQQELNNRKIVEKLLKEKENIEKKKKLYPNLFNINLKPLKPIIIKKNKEKHEKKLLTKVANTLGLTQENPRLFKNFEELNKQDDNGFDRRSVFDSTTIASRDDDEDSEFDELNNNEEFLVQPEYEGLWNKEFKKYDSGDLYKINQKFPSCYKTKTEKELYLKSLDNLKKSAIKDQVVAGKKFSGISFKSQPKIVHFKDFDINNVYNIKVILTNISYSINTCKFVDISESLKDFINIDFKPPGQLSAGLTCEFNVTFSPKINKDLMGELKFLATDGPFSIPISCTIKKCNLSVNTDLLSFETIVIGDELKKKLQLMNKGALGTNFKLITKRISKKTTESLQKDEFELRLEELPDGIKMGSIRSGFIEPFSTLDLEFIFIPTFPGNYKEKFVIKFEDESSKEIELTIKANAIDVPIWIENINIDLKICMYDRLYQDVIRVHNRASSALRITFEVPSELRNHLEILPKTAFIQAKSEFAAQIKFTAKKSLPKDAPQHFDSITGVLEVPLQIRVADQNKTVDYTLNAIVTTSDLEFDLKEIDFGYCTIYETVMATVSLTNHSILCQPFGFVNLPEFINVQPNDGFGTLLPNETIQLDINFSPKSAKEYKFTVTCKSLVNRDFIINCKGIGVHPPLKLSTHRINFKATAINSSSFKTIYVYNDHLDYDQHRHPVPRIGNGEISRVGPTYFEFDIPKESPFRLWPQVGCVEPGKKCKVTIQFTAKINEIEVKKSAAKLIKNKLTDKAKQITTSEQSLSIHSSDYTEVTEKLKKKSNLRSKPESSLSIHKQTDLTAKTPELDQIETGSSEYINGLSSALIKYSGDLHYFQIPCYISTVREHQDSEIKTTYSIHNTIYLDIICPTVRPEMIVVSNNINKTIDFGKVTIGQKCIRKIAIKNISRSTIELKSSLVDTKGPFFILNSLRPIEPGSIFNLIVAFIPNKSCVFHENFDIKTSKSNLSFVFNAIGVEPSFTLSLIENSIDFGYCLANEKIEKTIEMKNNSNIPIEYRAFLESKNDFSKANAELKRYQHLNNPNYKPIIGPNNQLGLNCFDVFPVQGSIAGGSKMNLKVLFFPDHSSDLYADTLKISLIANEENSRSIQLFGKSRKKNMYIRGVEYLTKNSNTESMILSDLESDEHKDENKDEKQSKIDKSSNKVPDELIIPTSVLLTLYSICSSKTVGEYSTAEKIIQIGCMKSNVLNDKKDGKKSGDFTFDNVKEIATKGFNIDLTKSAVEAGGERQVKITWKPPQGIDSTQTVKTNILLTTRSNTSEIWNIILEGKIVSESFNTN